MKKYTLENLGLISKKLKSKGKIIKPIGNIKKGGNRNEDRKPQIINLTRIFKLCSVFYFQSNNSTLISI